MSQQNFRCMRTKAKTGCNNRNFSLLPLRLLLDHFQCGVNPVVVHGGGPQIAAMLKRLDIPTSFVEVSTAALYFGQTNAWGRCTC